MHQEAKKAVRATKVGRCDAQSMAPLCPEAMHHHVLIHIVLCACVCVYIYMYRHMYVHICIYTYTHLHIEYRCMNTHECVYIYMYIHIDIYVYIGPSSGATSLKTTQIVVTSLVHVSPLLPLFPCKTPANPGSEALTSVGIEELRKMPKRTLKRRREKQTHL